jgi:hypothetical protein
MDDPVPGKDEKAVFWLLQAKYNFHCKNRPVAQTRNNNTATSWQLLKTCYVSFVYKIICYS